MPMQNSKCLCAELKVLPHGIQNTSTQKSRNLHAIFKISECIIKKHGGRNTELKILQQGREFKKSSHRL